jgi:hypothetical protein
MLTEFILQLKKVAQAKEEMTNNQDHNNNTHKILKMIRIFFGFLSIICG